MSFFSTYVASFGPREVGCKATELFDSGWVEYFGGQFLHCVLSNLGKVNQWYQYNDLKVSLGPRRGGNHPPHQQVTLEKE